MPSYPYKIEEKGVPYLIINIHEYPASMVKEAFGKLTNALQVTNLPEYSFNKPVAIDLTDPNYKTGKANFMSKMGGAKSTINIYIPEGLSYNTSSKWDNEEIVELASMATGDASVAQTIAAAATAGIKNSLTGGFVGKAAAELKFLSGLSLNLKDRLLFQGTENQVLQLKFELCPQTEQEALEVNEIVNTLKKATIPAVYGGNENILQSPDIFSMSIVKKTIKNGKECISSTDTATANNMLGEATRAMALTNIVIKPNLGDTQPFYVDGNAIGYDVDLTFKSLFKVFSGA